MRTESTRFWRNKEGRVQYVRQTPGDKEVHVQTMIIKQAFLGACCAPSATQVSVCLETATAWLLQHLSI